MGSILLILAVQLTGAAVVVGSLTPRRPRRVSCQPAGTVSRSVRVLVPLTALTLVTALAVPMTSGTAYAAPRIPDQVEIAGLPEILPEDEDAAPRADDSPDGRLEPRQEPPPRARRAGRDEDRRPQRRDAAASGPRSYADGKTLSLRQVARVVKVVGLPCVTGTAVAYAESGGDTGVRSRTPGEDSRGLFQINEVHGFAFDWDDAYANAGKAKEIFRAAGGWGPWGAYTDGSYRAYLGQAAAACG